ncbi:hypothetical protein MFRU_045g00730 [Monilinia fructicola]|uniref:Bromo domain-containing protein n=1 Tax=Monilinia fructicola TaxID=38448 RepID=A0A5M9JCK9_MONFR|nr:hypothetical protein EYC84_011093 [Monilinia fructicola]KAG4026128.1 hypothetical protein MFRU_045g00730 [Monilinia fructicola]
MTTQHSEDLALEQKTIPVPSSDTMALDLNINGTSTRDDSKTEEQQTTSDAELKKSPETNSSESAELTSTPELNGRLNADSDAVDSTLPQPTLVESHTQDTPESQNVSQPQDSNTTVASEEATKSVEEPERAVSDLPTPADSVPDAVIESLAPTAVPPIVEAPESDIRDEVSPLTQVPEAIPQSTLPASDEKEEPAKEEPPISAPEASAPAPETKAESVDDMNLNFDAPRRDLPPSSPNVAPPSVDMEVSPRQKAPAEPITASAPANLESKDVEMTDAPAPAPAQPQVTKVAREREDDGEEEPLAKRTKTEESEEHKESSKLGTPAVIQNGVTTNGTSSNGSTTRPITQHETKEIVKIIKNVIKTAAGKNFRSPVAILWPGFAEAYAQKVENEIDLGTMEKKIKSGEYPSIQAIKDDAVLLYENAVAFNGLDNPITVAANDVKTSIISKLGSLPPEPPAHVAKAQVKKPKRPTPSLDAAPRVPVARRPSRGSTGAAVPMSAPAPTFALDPVTSTPLIRRDSTKDGRPKREIHPPKNKDLPYSSVRPKSKKYSVELKWCEETLNEMKKAKYHVFSSAFLTPVDPVALQIPNYFTVIKSPMDISTVSEKLHNGVYTRAKEFEQDVKLIFQNCYKFNPEGNPVRIMGQQFEEVFNGLLAKKDRWIADHQPVAMTPDRDDDTEEDEESEDEPEPVPEVTQGAATARLIVEQTKLIDMLSKPEASDAIDLQRKVLALVQEAADREKEKQAAVTKKPIKKSRPSKPSKKAAPTKKATTGPTKKSGGVRRDRYMGTVEKEVIAAGIGLLPDQISTEMMELIKLDQPGMVIEEDGTMELEIESITPQLLWKIYDAIHEHLPQIEANVRASFQDKKEEPRVAQKPAQKKKNKPMSKVEQERKIALLKEKVQDFSRGAGSTSQEPIESVEQHTQEESSGDESSDSEEE